MAENDNREGGDRTGAGANVPSTPPRSATSRARRIGGAATPQPGPAPSRGGAAPSAEANAPAGRVGTADTMDLAKSPSHTEGPKATRRTIRVVLPGWSAWTPAIAFAAVAVVFLSLFLVDRVGGEEPPGRSQATRTKVLAAAKTCLATLNTYRYDQLAAYTAAGVKCTTGKLTSDFKQAATTLIGKNAPTLQSVQQAKITTAGIESVTGDGKQWTVLAYGTLAITTKTQKQGRNDPFAVVARLQQVGGSWLLAKIDNVSSATS